MVGLPSPQKKPALLRSLALDSSPCWGCCCCLAQVAEDSGLGFKLIHDTFASYWDLPRSQQPTTDAAKLQTWVVQQSKAAGVNLGPYYQCWGYPVSAATEEELKKLPRYQV